MYIEQEHVSMGCRRCNKIIEEVNAFLCDVGDWKQML